MQTRWQTELHDEFEPEFDRLPESVRDEILALMGLLEEFGPKLGPPAVELPPRWRHARLKALRFDAADGVWRVAFKFVGSKAIVLAAGDMSGKNADRFYLQLLRKAGTRFRSK